VVIAVLDEAAARREIVEGRVLDRDKAAKVIQKDEGVKLV
jgi:hypothetical protein